MGSVSNYSNYNSYSTTSYGYSGKGSKTQADRTDRRKNDFQQAIFWISNYRLAKQELNGVQLSLNMTKDEISKLVERVAFELRGMPSFTAAMFKELLIRDGLMEFLELFQSVYQTDVKSEFKIKEEFDKPIDMTSVLLEYDKLKNEFAKQLTNYDVLKRQCTRFSNNASFTLSDLKPDEIEIIRQSMQGLDVDELFVEFDKENTNSYRR